MKRSARLFAVLLFLLGLGLLAALIISYKEPVSVKIPVSPDVLSAVRLDAVLPLPSNETGERHVSSIPGGAAPGGRQEVLAEKRGTDRDVIENEYVLSFFDEKDRKAFMDLATARGVKILGLMKFGNAVRIRVENGDQYRQLLRDGPTPVDRGSNYRVYSPEGPQNPLKPPKTPYLAFAGHSLKWLGVSGDNSQWGKGITVAVLDTGVFSHSALVKDQIIHVDMIGDGDGGSGSHAWHGTAVASLIAGNSEALRGVSPAATILSVKVLGSDGTGSTFVIAQGIVEAADRGARVINICLGTYGNSYILQDAVEYALRQGAVIVAATGNDAAEGLLYPARYPGVVAVAGVDAAEQHVYFSNRGPEVDIAAPSLGITAAGEENGLASFSGTSASAPFVSGVLAWLLSEESGLSGSEAVAMMQAYANDAGAPGRDEEIGFGILNVQRLQQRNVPTVYDIAVGNPYMNPVRSGDTYYTITVFAQNRGTATLPSATLSGSVGDIARTTTVYNLAVGKLVTLDLQISPERVEAGPVSISTTAAAGGVQDVNPLNNSRRSSLVLRSGE